MIVEPSGMLLVLLAVLTLLGAVMGYCVALIRSKRIADQVIETERAKLHEQQLAQTSDLQSARDSITLHRPPDTSAKTLESHSQKQANRIKSLEAKLRELQLGNSAVTSDTDNLPTLSRRVGGQKSVPQHAFDKLSRPLTRELEIPTLAESELPDSIDDLEFDLFNKDDSGVVPRG